MSPSMQNVHADCENGFRSACRGGSPEVVRLLLSLTGEREVNVHIHGPEHLTCHWSEVGFVAACKRGNIDIVRELLELKGDRLITDVLPGLAGAAEEEHFETIRVIFVFLGNYRDNRV